MDSTLEKSFKLFFDFLCATSCVLIIPLFFSPVSETLLLVSKERLIFYAISYGLSFLFFGEVVGTRESNFQFGLGKNFLLPITAASFAVLVLLLVVGVIEYSFIGRFAIVKILLCTAVISLISSFLIKKFFSENRVGVYFCFLQKEEKLLLRYQAKSNSFNWIDLDETKADLEFNIQKICEEENVDLLVIDAEVANRNFDIVSILGSGTQVIGLLDFWQKYIGCIPPSEVNQSWLSKLDLRIRNPLALKLKRFADVIFSIFALISFTITFICFLVVALTLGFP